MVHDQTLSIDQNRIPLLEVFCHYDLGNLSVDELEQHMLRMGIKPTQAYRNYMRKQCGTLKFNEFVKALSTSDDQLINGMMTRPTPQQPMRRQNVLPESQPYQSRGIGVYNPSMSRYSKHNDFLKWKSPDKIHFNEPLANPQKQMMSRSPVGDEVESMRSSVNLDPNMMYATRSLIQLYSRNGIDINQLESRLKQQFAAQGMELNALQQRVIAKCKTSPNVKLSELYLAFADPKAQMIGNFNSNEAHDAKREPLIFVDHPGDIITWNGDDPQTTFREMTKRKTFHQDANAPRSLTTNMLHWDEMTNQEFNAKVIRKRPPPKGTKGDIFRSKIEFNDQVYAAEMNQKVPKPVANARRSTPNILNWEKNNAQSNGMNQIQQKPYRPQFEKFRHDDRVPYRQR